ncbi:hypothetical protein U1Q18_032597 [Sarracenia purpurea var. burkii]
MEAEHTTCGEFMEVVENQGVKARNQGTQSTGKSISWVDLQEKETLSKSPRIGEIEDGNKSEYKGKGRLPHVRGFGATESGKEKRATTEQVFQWIANPIEKSGENNKQTATPIVRGFRNLNPESDSTD